MEQTIKISVLQELFKNKNKYFLNKKNGHTGVPDDGEGNQGEYNEYFKYYRHPEMPENLFMRERYETDSYGETEGITHTEFVKGKEKTITVFEPI